MSLVGRRWLAVGKYELRSVTLPAKVRLALVPLDTPPAPMRLPRCVCSPCLPVTYQPAQRSAIGRAMVHLIRLLAGLELAFLIRGDRTQDRSGHAETPGGAVAAQAIGIADELRLADLLLFQRVEDGAELRIHGRDLEFRRTRDEAEIDVVVEVERARVSGVISLRCRRSWRRRASGMTRACPAP